MNNQEWYYAHLRWAVMVEGAEGLREWKDAVHIFRSDNHESAFQQALTIGHMAEQDHEEGRRQVESRLAEVVRLHCLGTNPAEFQVDMGSKRAKEKLSFEHVFRPEVKMPEAPF